MMKFFLALLLAASIYVCGAAEEKAPAAEADKMTISADRFEWTIGNVLKLDGNVLVQDSAMSLNSEHMLVFFEEEKDKEGKSGDAGSTNIKRIEVTGRVMVRTADNSRSATGDRGVYEADKETITLDGDCTILADGAVMRSNRVVFDRKKQTVTAERGTISIKTSGNRGSNFGGIFGGGDSKERRKEQDAGKENADKKSEQSK